MDNIDLLVGCLAKRLDLMAMGLGNGFSNFHPYGLTKTFGDRFYTVDYRPEIYLRLVLIGLKRQPWLM